MSAEASARIAPNSNPSAVGVSVIGPAVPVPGKATPPAAVTEAVRSVGVGVTGVADALGDGVGVAEADGAGVGVAGALGDGSGDGEGGELGSAAGAADALGEGGSVGAGLVVGAGVAVGAGLAVGAGPWCPSGSAERRSPRRSRARGA